MAVFSVAVDDPEILSCMLSCWSGMCCRVPGRGVSQGLAGLLPLLAAEAVRGA